MKLSRLINLAIVAGVLMIPGIASARWDLSDVKWHMTARGSLGFAERGPNKVTDTTYVAAGVNRPDTTGEFSLLDCDNQTMAEAGITTVDSLADAYLIIQSDTTGSNTTKFVSTSVQFQVNYGQSNIGWMNVGGALTPLSTDGSKIAIVPIFRRLAAITTDIGVDGNVLSAAYGPRVRAIVTWLGAGVAVPSARVRVKKYIRSTHYIRTDSTPR